MRTLRLVLSLIAVMLIAVIFCGCTSNKIGTVFSTSYQIEIEGSNSNKISNYIEELLVEYENLFSVTISTSDIYKINNAKSNVAIKVSKDTIYLVKLSKELYLKTQGQFNPAIFPLTILWGFDPSSYTATEASIPTDDEIQSTLLYCTMDNFLVDEFNSTITKLDDNAMLDFGGIAKGYAVDKTVEKCTNQKSYLINIGGEISIGNTEKTIAIADPFKESQIIKTLTLKNTAIATSGVYERFFTYNNIKYHHILSKNGYPAQTDIISVTVIAKNTVICDALATCGILLDEESFRLLLNEYNAEAIVITNDAQIKTIK